MMRKAVCRQSTSEESQEHRDSCWSRSLFNRLVMELTGSDVHALIIQSRRFVTALECADEEVLALLLLPDAERHATQSSASSQTAR